MSASTGRGAWAPSFLIALTLAACGQDATSPPLPLPASEAPKADRGKPGGGGGGGEPYQDDFESWDPARWSAGDHPLGKGWLHPGNVTVSGGLLSLRLPAGTHDGGEIRSAERVRYGIFEARLRAADTPGSLTAFFLYEYTRSSIDEIDIEILGDGSGRVLFTTWLRSRQTNHTEVVLPFDPSADFHDYRIEWSSKAIRFAVDGVVRAEFVAELPGASMYVMANAWWPNWLSDPAPGADEAAAFDWIRY